MRKIFELAMSLVVLALFSGVAFLNFYRINFESLVGPSRTLHCYLVVLAAAILIALAAKSLFTRIFLIVAALSFMAFSYDEIKLQLSRDVIKAFTGEANFVKLSILCRALAMILTVLVVGIFSRNPVFLEGDRPS